MIVRTALHFGRSQLADSPTPALDARLLLQHVLQVDYPHLIVHDDESLTEEQESCFRTLVARARRHEPIPYLTGRAPFFGLDFHVSPDVLIPRPETEQLLTLAIERAHGRADIHIVDAGTGSGCIAISLAVHLPQARITAVDISADALLIARRNEAEHAPGRIQFLQGNLLQPVVQPIDLLVANLPYIADGEWTMLDDGVKLFEPSRALKGGADGLDVIRALLRQATAKLNPGGVILLEIGWQQGPAARQLAESIFPAARVEIHPDLAGRDRIIIVDTTI